MKKATPKNNLRQIVRELYSTPEGLAYLLQVNVQTVYNWFSDDHPAQVPIARELQIRFYHHVLHTYRKDLHGDIETIFEKEMRHRHGRK